MARYPLFKPGDNVEIEEPIKETISSRAIIDYLRFQRFKGTIVYRLPRRRGSQPTYKVKVGGNNFNIYASFLRKIT